MSLPLRLALGPVDLPVVVLVLALYMDDIRPQQKGNCYKLEDSLKDRQGSLR